MAFAHQLLRKSIKDNMGKQLAQMRSFDELYSTLSELKQKEQDLIKKRDSGQLSEQELNVLRADLAEVRGVKFGILYALGIVDKE